MEAETQTGEDSGLSASYKEARKALEQKTGVENVIEVVDQLHEKGVVGLEIIYTIDDTGGLREILDDYGLEIRRVRNVRNGSRHLDKQHWRIRVEKKGDSK